jgi:hypothetical protein
MNCKKSWDRGFLGKNISKSFVRTKYKQAREKHLFDRETALMPASQIKVERLLYARKQDVKISELQKEINVRKHELGQLYPVDVETKKRTNQLEVEIFMLTKKIELCKFKKNYGSHTNEKRSFIRKCGFDGCRGFLSTQWKCGLCNNHTCKECLAIKGENHVCNPGDVETAKLLASDSKPCPSCGTLIFKIEGCDQMYCTLCNTPFSWRSGMIVSGRIHNPHYYEYMRQRNGQVREIGDIPCGGLPPVSRLPAFPTDLRKDLLGAYRLCIHIQEDTMRTLQDRDTEQYRIMYLLNDINEQGFRSNIQRIEKANSKKLEYRMIYGTFCDVVMDLFRNVTRPSQYGQMVQELHSLVSYVNEQFQSVAVTFDCKAPVIYLPGWTLYPPA